MADRDPETLAERNRETLLTARVPLGLKPRVEATAKADGMSVSAYVTSALEEKLARRDSTLEGNTQ